MDLLIAVVTSHLAESKVVENHEQWASLTESLLAEDSPYLGVGLPMWATINVSRRSGNL